MLKVDLFRTPVVGLLVQNNFNDLNVRVLNPRNTMVVLDDMFNGSDYAHHSLAYRKP
jgi:hypothetical protein